MHAINIRIFSLAPAYDILKEQNPAGRTKNKILH